MIVTFWKGIFVADSIDEKGALKRAGFELHEPSTCHLRDEGGTCKACRAKIGRRWWSNRVEAATRLKQFCNERALRVMKTHLEMLKKSRATDSLISIPAPPGLNYLPYQRGGVAYCVQRKDTLVADDMGLGKSIEALGFINYLKPKRTLIVCPATLIFNWRNEAEKWITGFDFETCIVESKNDVVPDKEGIVVIVNYEKLGGDSKLHKSIMTKEWDVGIFDEAQYIKNPESARSKAIIGPEGVATRSKRSLFLTGTPIENYPKEIWPIAAFLCPAKFGNWWDFAKRYCSAHQQDRKYVDPKTGNEYWKKVWVTEGASNLGELQQRLRATFMVRRLKKDVLPELPPKRRQLIILQDPKKDWSKDPRFRRWKEVYEKQYEDVSAKLEAAKTDEEYRAAAKELDEVTGIPFTEFSEVRHEVALAKLPLCIKYIDEILAAGTQNLVVFAHHRDVLEALAEKYAADCVVVHGGTPSKGPKSREEAVKAFQEGRKKIFIGQTRAAGVGITLTAADTVVFVEVDWVPGVVTQCEDRLCRIGQKKMVHVIHTVLGGTMEVNMIQKLIKKQDVIDKALDKMPEIKLKQVRKIAS
jgi:SWI/SNF-related matrix-associated actin-dependent regulator of chromatin subfamily A-like protein 1